MIGRTLGRFRRGIRKPPRVILTKLNGELRAEIDRFLAPYYTHRTSLPYLLKHFESSSLSDLWAALARTPYVAATAPVDPNKYEALCPDSRDRILGAAQNALEHRVDLLGSGPVELGDRIDWHTDFKTGINWPPAYMRSIKYADPQTSSDVKVPWELSRVQWLIPAGQAFLLTSDEKYAECVRDILLQWIDANPYAYSVNWACTMEVALRIVAWTWFFHALHNSRAWNDPDFQWRFLQMLFLHGFFTQRHLECSDVNGNHYTADAAGLVFAGLFFGRRGYAGKWHELGWHILTTELPRQVYSDGVDFEASVPYHRLVCELFFLPALYRERLGLSVPANYRERVIRMAQFTTAYSRTELPVPLWGDGDDARILPFGGQSLNDHRYLAAVIARHWNVEELRGAAAASTEELFWLHRQNSVLFSDSSGQSPQSSAFHEGGVYIMRNRRGDHVFIDCGPAGLGGRGGHGHNDCLSFEAVLDGVHLISDCGSYVYTASYEERNRFRSTAYHNTPQIDGLEINRFIHPDNLWNLHYDAKPVLHRWATGPSEDLFMGSHRGYERLPEPVVPVRTIRLIHATHELIVEDEFTGTGQHEFKIPLHLPPGVSAERDDDRQVLLLAGRRSFILSWNPSPWSVEIGPARVSPSYGVSELASRIIWSRRGPVDIPLRMSIEPRR